MNGIIIKGKTAYVGFINEISAIVAQGSTVEEVKDTIDRIYRIHRERTNTKITPYEIKWKQHQIQI